MRSFLFALIGASLLFVGCTTETKSDIQLAKDAFDADPTEETYSALMEITMAAIRDVEADDAVRKEAMLIGMDASETANNKIQSIGFINTYIKEYSDSEDVPDKLFQLGALLADINKKEAAYTILQGFLAHHSDHEMAAEARKMLPDSLPEIDVRLKQIGESMFDAEKGQLETGSARSFVDACEAYALANPNADNAADYLHKAAETARAMRTIPKALSLYDWILDRYPNHSKAPQALFLKAFTYDNNLGDIESAREHYEAFLAKYPEDDFADDTEFLLENLGKSDEEILEALTKKKQAN
jgi:TolA-binding protein